MKPTLVIYTHTDYKDVWVPMFKRLEEYSMLEYSITVLLNDDDIDIPPYCKIIKYDDTLPYTERLKSAMSQITDDVILFMHEDMILYSEPDHNELSRLSEHITSGRATSIKLIYVKGYDVTSSFDNKLISNQFSMFSIQPTLISTSYLSTILKYIPPVNIWQFEGLIRSTDTDFMYFSGLEKPRGSYHYDSLIYPYIATAIVKGKWNTREYPIELSNMFTQYQIDKNIRGEA